MRAQVGARLVAITILTGVTRFGQTMPSKSLDDRLGRRESHRRTRTLNPRKF
jgi:hypothetical protein